MAKNEALSSYKYQITNISPSTRYCFASPPNNSVTAYNQVLLQFSTNEVGEDRGFVISHVALDTSTCKYYLPNKDYIGVNITRILYFTPFFHSIFSIKVVSFPPFPFSNTIDFFHKCYFHFLKHMQN